jgi:adenylate cyclase
MSDDKKTEIEQMWHDWFVIDAAMASEKQKRKFFGVLPKNPRCKFCNAPFEGIGASVARTVFGKQRSNLNSRFCNMCEEHARKFPGGAEVEMSILFADVRGSTALSEKMSAMDFSKLINRFYTQAASVIVQADGLVDKLAGDSVAAFWGAGFAGPHYVRRTLEVAENLLRVTGHADPNGPWVPIGVGVHTGVAFFGSMGTAGGLTDITAVGEEVNTAARLAAQAGTGEIIVSETALKAAGVDGSQLEARSLSLKGISQPVAVRVMRLS